MRLLAAIRGPNVGLRLGAESAAGPTASLRHALLAGATATTGPWESDLDVKALPPQAGSAGVSGTLAVRRDWEPASFGLALDARRSSFGVCAVCPQRSLSAVGLSAELGASLPFRLKAGARAAAWAVELRGDDLMKVSGSRSGRATESALSSQWDRYGASTLEWAERWDLGLRLEREFDLVTAAITGSIGAPAQQAALCQRTSASLQRGFGRLRLALGAGVAHLSPTGQWLAEASLSVGVHLGGPP